MASLASMASLLPIDPDGDVELLLRPERDLRMVWEFAPTPSPSSLGYRRGVTPEAHQGKTKEKARIELEPRMETEQEQAPPLAKIPPAPNTENMRARIRVSSRHLMLASAYFKRSLGGELAEGHTLRYEGRVEVNMKGQDLDTILLVMNMIHGRFRSLPSSVGLDALTRIATLVDYLECHEVVEPFVNNWIEQMRGRMTRTYSKKLIQWICICQVFNKASLFKTVTLIAIRQARDVVDKADLPIRDRIEGKE
jgi:hypothetical protein